MLMREMGEPVNTDEAPLATCHSPPAVWPSSSQAMDWDWSVALGVAAPCSRSSKS